MRGCLRSRFRFDAPSQRVHEIDYIRARWLFCRFDPLRDKFVLKINPLAGWSREQVWGYVHKHRIPYNPLAERGFRSIGCLPCTRAVGVHEDERAGRWTGFEKTECGLHTFMGSHV